MTLSDRILTAGRIYCDLVFTELDARPAPGREVFAEGLALRAGGGAYITAAYLSALGHQAALIGTLPVAPFDAVIRAEMAETGVDPICTPAPPGSDPQITAAFMHGNDRAFVTRRPGPALTVTGPLPAARHLHLGEITTARDHPELIPMARAAGMSLSLDCSWDGQALAGCDLSGIIAAVDLFFPNEAEAAELHRHGVDASPKVATIIKLGAQGAEIRPARGPVQHCAAKQVRLKDTTGAGDAFNAGFLSAWLKGQTAAECLDLGTYCGAIAVGRVGGAGALPPLDSLAMPLHEAGQ
ncbi:carbohydrate kinase family protein [Rhodophyticola sp. CCM32]|uniref:carbohydrate kinase family protein n=1 Tax=Rhodophyticola sp. CCM32 TaxID=2916397 RepID=UPI00107FD349|nr:carbohydrate kinase family protein [Rhodophyticola sp. CCM32]QBX99964.1 carbohydrate kinase family protein [Rhodophyticola sp. CCM32]